MKALIKASMLAGLTFGLFAAPAVADGFKDCTKLD